MSSPSESFECHWRCSRRLVAVCVAGYGLALIACALLALPWPVRGVAMLLCVIHGVWTLPRRVLLTDPDAVTGLRRDRAGWQVWTVRQGWQRVQLRPDSVALPGLVILRYRRPGQWLSRSACVMPDGLDAEQHRRLCVRLTFSRRRWAAVAVGSRAEPAPTEG